MLPSGRSFFLLRATTVSALTLGLFACGGHAHAVPSVVATSTSAPNNPLACTSAGSPQSILRNTDMSLETTPKRSPSVAEPGYSAGVLEITYRVDDPATATDAASLIAHRGGRIDAQIVLANAAVTQIVTLPVAQEERALAASTNAVRVSRSAKRYLLSTTAALTNDPYLQGFSPSNAPPFYESSAVPGQWDLHQICAANAWGYGNENTTEKTYPGAKGGTARIAIIDTGADLTHPELAGRVIYQESVLNGTVTTDNMHDNDGHGTDVAGIAGAAANNALGFAGVAYAAPLMIFKVFPDPPDGGCIGSPKDPRCSTDGADVAIAIRDAVTHGAKVINLSLGAPTPDTAEENAVASAIAAGVVIVAASGNERAANLDYPANDPEVIAVGASALDDSKSTIAEKVAAYSNYSASNPGNWGLVAPGGEPASDNDADDLHWIENIYTSTAADGSSADACVPDRGGTTADCRIFIAGTSQAAPHVTGSVALLLGVAPSLTSGMIKSLLCSSAIPIAGGHAGCGKLNVYRALAQAVGDPHP